MQILIKNKIYKNNLQILMLQLCVDEQLTDRGDGKKSGKKGVASIDYIDQLLINFDQLLINFDQRNLLDFSFFMLAILGTYLIWYRCSIIFAALIIYWPTFD